MVCLTATDITLTSAAKFSFRSLALTTISYCAQSVIPRCLGFGHPCSACYLCYTSPRRPPGRCRARGRRRLALDSRRRPAGAVSTAGTAHQPPHSLTMVERARARARACPAPSAVWLSLHAMDGSRDHLWTQSIQRAVIAVPRVCAAGGRWTVDGSRWTVYGRR